MENIFLAPLQINVEFLPHKTIVKESTSNCGQEKNASKQNPHSNS